MHQVSRIQVGSGMTMSPGYGDVMLRADLGDGKSCVLKLLHVLLLPQCPVKLVATSPFVRAGCKAVMENTDELSISRDGVLLLRGKESGGLYVLLVDTIKATAQPLSSFTMLESADKSIHLADQLLRMHRGYGHLNFDTLRKVLGWPRAKTGGNPNCHECEIVKSQRSALSKSTFKRSVRPIHRMHMDVMFGAFSKYVFQLTADDHGRKSWLQQMQDKSQTLATFKLLKSKVENDKAPYKVAIMHTDSGGEYNDKAWKAFRADEGIEHEFSTPYRQGGNGVIEARGKLVGYAARAMILYSAVPNSDIPDAFDHSNTCVNNFPHSANHNNATPNEVWYGVRLEMSRRLCGHLRLPRVLPHPREAAAQE